MRGGGKVFMKNLFYGSSVTKFVSRRNNSFDFFNELLRAYYQWGYLCSFLKQILNI